MTPEERLNQQVWETLQNIQEEILVTEVGKPVKYRIPNIVGVGTIPSDRRRKILYKLQEKKAFEIQRNLKGTRIGTGDIFYLIINPSKFDEVYTEYSFMFSKPDNKVVASDHSRKEVSAGVVAYGLQAKYLEVQDEKNEGKFYLKLSSYGKYLNDQNLLIPAISLLQDESQDQLFNLKKAWGNFFKKWRVLAKDLIETADANGIIDEGPLQNEIEEVKAFLDQPDPQFNNDELPYYFRSYREIILRFNKLGKENLIAREHLYENGNIKLYLEYNKIEAEWDKFKRIREISTWWAHYQITRLACGVFGTEEEKIHYFDDDNEVDKLYKYEFENISRGNTDNLAILKRPKFEVWLKRLHSYLIPHLRELPSNQTVNAEQYYQLLDKLNLMYGNKTVELKNRYEELLSESKTNKFSPKEKHDVLQAIWTVYESNSRSNSILVPTAGLTAKGQKIENIDEIFDELKKDGCFAKWERKDRWYHLENVDHDVLPEIFRKAEEDTVANPPAKNKLLCGKLQIDLDQGVIRCGNDNPVEISPDNNIVKFLVVLIQNKRIVEYTEIAKKLEMNCWHEGTTNKEVAREVQFLRRDLTTFLRDKVHMTDKKIKEIIVVKKNFGYKLRCV